MNQNFEELFTKIVRREATFDDVSDLKGFCKDICEGKFKLSEDETLLFSALVFWLYVYRPTCEKNFTSVMKLLNAFDEDRNKMCLFIRNTIDRIFHESYNLLANSIKNHGCVTKEDVARLSIDMYFNFRTMYPGNQIKAIINLKNALSFYNDCSFFELKI